MSWLYRRAALVIGALLVGAIILAAALAPWLAPHDPLAQDVLGRLQAPGAKASPLLGGSYPLGSDDLGRDIWSRLLFGARVSLVVGVGAGVLGALVGSIVGISAGYLGGIIDAVVSALADIQTAIPFLVLAIAAVGITGGGIGTIILILGLGSWVVYARILRAETLALRQRPFIEASRALGLSEGQVIRRHIIPNLSGSILVVLTQQITAAILYEAALGFLGLDVPPPQPSWGNMVYDGSIYLPIAWWVSVFPGLAITFAALGIGLVGDGLYDLLRRG